MLVYKFWTKDYKQEYYFEFEGKRYLTHSIVRLTDEGQRYLESNTKEVILTEQFINWNGVRCWKYEFKKLGLTGGVTTASTDRPPSELIDEVVIPSNQEYAEREIFGMESPAYKNGIKHTKKDWEIPEVRNGWIILILVIIGASIFKDWYVQLIIRAAAGWIFGLYRQAYVNAHTTYTHDEDTEILRKKLEILYGVKFNKEDNSNE